MPELHEKIKSVFDFGTPVPEIPDYISRNLKYPFYDWQKKAFEYFLINEKKEEQSNEPTHLMFNMATGTGKTLVMASALLYYYKKGYRSFIFFVNQNNIVDKTENNFLDSRHNKYLFKNKIIIDNKTISIKKVDNFSDNPDGIEIKFTTIQKLYNDIHLEKENQTTREDLNMRDVVMLADEAHHLNADTTKGAQEELGIVTELKDNTSKTEVERKGWEHTVIEIILKKNGKENNKNVLLEFTATIPDNENVSKKYQDKIVYKFGLPEFLNAGYTKEINLISSTLGKKERILHALLFSWYRHKIALDNDIHNFKPVILFRSKTIDDSKNDFEDFLNFVENISENDFNFIKEIDKKINEGNSLYEQGKSRTRDVIEYISKNKIRYSEIADFIKYNFQERNLIITNSKDKKAKGKRGGEKTTNEQEQLLNNLEDKDNNIRAIFTVERLTEGWDVLNLFDIVRLYQEQSSGGSTNATPESTTKEKQLIGRGVRYFPFTYEDKLKNKRKFDNDLENPLRVLEELFFYTYDEKARYISFLKNELRKDGYIQDGKDVKTFSLKPAFKNSVFYRNTKIWQNEQKKNPNRTKKNLIEVKKDFSFNHRKKGIEISEEEFGVDSDEDTKRLYLQENGLKTKSITIKEIEKNVFRKAINILAKSDNSFFQFKNLKENFDIEKVDDLLKSVFLGNFKINITMESNGNISDISNKEKLEMLLGFLNKFEKEMESFINLNVGTKFKEIDFSKVFGESKLKSIKETDESRRVSKELEDENWYVLNSFVGSSEEIELIEYIKTKLGNLKEKYKEHYLLRNEEVYKIYDFETGQGFQPDFILFLKGTQKMYYQIFIEPKGEHLMKTDKWKNDFLKEITKRYGSENILKSSENDKYQIIGIPFFNKKKNTDFVEEFEKIL